LLLRWLLSVHLPPEVTPMPENEPSYDQAATEPTPPPRRPKPPPFDLDTELIAYIEKGQKPTDQRPAPPAEEG